MSVLGQSLIVENSYSWVEILCSVQEKKGQLIYIYKNASSKYSARRLSNIVNK